MADIDIATISTVGTTLTSVEGDAGEAITIGRFCYKHSTSGTWYHADCETSIVTAAAVGISFNGAALGAKVRLITGGILNLTLNSGSLPSKGDSLWLSTAGLIMPETDKASNDWATMVGLATDTLQMEVKCYAFNLQV